MQLVRLNSPADVAQQAADRIVERINQFQPSAERPFVLGLPTGGTPLLTYQALIRAYQAGQVSFKHVVSFNMDEYVGLAPSHPQSYHAFMQQHFFQYIDIHPENTHIPNGMATDLEAECQRYEQLIVSYGKIQLFLGGVGENGHIAFNEPNSDWQSYTHLVTLTPETRQANARFFENIAEVPTQALTVGVQTLLNANELLILATGANKKQAVQAALLPPDKQWTISALQQHPNATLLCDSLALGSK